MKRALAAILVLAALAAPLSGCASSKEEQRYSWPLATASPEDTVTQLFAEKFGAEKVSLLNRT